MVADKDWDKIKEELNKNIEPVFRKTLGNLDLPFDQIVDLLRVVLEKEIGDKDLDDREEIKKAIAIRYKFKDVEAYSTAVVILALKLESFFKRLFSIVGESLWVNENNMLKGQIVTFIRKFKFTYLDPDFSSADDTVLNRDGEFFKTDTDRKPTFEPNYFTTKLPFGKEFKVAYDIRNSEGHLDPDFNDDDNSLIIKDLIIVYLFTVYKYHKKIQTIAIHKPTNNNVTNWNIFKALSNGFDRRQAYFLIIDKLFLTDDQLRGFSKINWDFVFDFDSNSDNDGLQYNVSKNYNLAINQIIHTTDDRNNLPSFPDKTTFWYYAKGNNNIQRSKPNNDTYSDWRTMYGRFSQNLMVKFYEENFSRKSTIINVVIISKQIAYIKDIIYAIKDMESNLQIRFIFANEDNSLCKTLINELNAESVEIATTDILEGFRQIESNKSFDPNAVHVPCISAKGKSILLPSDVVLFVRQYFKIIHKDIVQENEPEISNKSFYQGRSITWTELDNNYDVNRDITKDIISSLKTWLQARGDSGLFNLIHHPGSGGTTIARRIAFHFHQEFPVLLLNETISDFDENKIADRLHQIFSITEIPTLVIIDNSNISRPQIEQLKRTVEHRLAKAIFLNIESGFNIPKQNDNIFYLKSDLDKIETSRFITKFSKEFSDKSEIFSEIINESNRSLLTPFYFGLIANEENFITIEKYVRIRLESITEKEKDLLLLLAYFSHYAKGKLREVPHFVISNFLNIDEDFIQLEKHIDNKKILDLIIETEPDQHIYWRTIHPIISYEILKQNFSYNQNNQLNPSKLKQFSDRVIESLRKISDLRNSEILSLLYSVFIQRNETYSTEENEEEGTNDNNNIFSSLINDLQTNQNRIEIFDKLTTEFPKEHAHFWGHFSRAYSIDKDFTNALKAIDTAIKIDEEDNRLYHIKGMCFRTELYRIKDLYFGKREEITQDIFNDVVKFFELAEEEFFKVFDLAPQKAYAYVSYIQMVTQTLDFGFSVSSHKNAERDFTSFITSPSTEWYRSILTKAKESIDEYNSNNKEIKNSKLEQHNISLLKFWGKKDQMVNAWQGLLGNPNYDQNLVRRQLAYAYLAKGDFNWNNLKGKELLRIQELTSINLQGFFTDKDLNLWFEVSRRLKENINTLINKLEDLEFKYETLNSAYYLMALYAVKALVGGSLSAVDSHEKYKEKIKGRTKTLYNKVFCPEWIGESNDEIVLINHKDIGNWSKENQFFMDYSSLKKLEGKVIKYNRPQEGFIEVKGTGIKAIYQPAKFGHYHTDAEKGTKVEFYLGFNYDGVRAFEVKTIIE
ncbi:hypothetical protein R1T16_12115 [Flavobacterium sp. DG1-102-2]|uniref:P-loop NTPase n=1 Tax=Flavobacterium sp. DG1-102-2 TaxID=3081663 RepID=UPI002948C5C0|nr:hypothetical protein [Flavobacterium sp. DG1-102-2]MDV6169171.1 hypothetical protein [Flavobacterium sp. DG1-102-2]